MKALLPPINAKGLSEPHFSHAEMLQITGLTAATVLTWYRRGFIPEVAERKRRGRGRRKYSPIEVIHLAAIRALVKAHVPVANCAIVAARIVDLSLVRAWELLRYCETEEEMNSVCPGLLAVYSFDEPMGKDDLKFDLLTPNGTDGAFSGDIQAWMREKSITKVALIDLGGLAMSVFLAMEQCQGGFSL